MSDDRYPWLRRRRPGPGVDWEFFTYWTLVAIFVGLGILVLQVHLAVYGPNAPGLFSDAALYFEATRVWLAGGDPWTVQLLNSPRFAAPPPVLLLNVPLLPFGQQAAVAFWVIADIAGWAAIIWRLRLGPWWVLFPPFLEGFFPASPDIALAGLVVVSGGAIAAMTKPYSIPSLIADRRWAALAIAAFAVVVTIPILPWAQFFAQLPEIQQALADQSRDVSAWGQPVLMVLVVAALISLGPRTALRLVTPTLWPNAQLHYSVFSARAGAESAALAVALAFPGYTAQLVIVYATVIGVLRVAQAMARSRAGSAPPSEAGTADVDGTILRSS